jgi:cardiolipin synthase A/B
MRLSHVRRALIVIAAAGAVLAVALLLHQDRYVLRIQSAVMAEDEDHASYVAALVGAGLSSGNRFEVLTGGEEIFSAMLEAIDGATRRVSFETYIYDSGDVAERFTTAFEQAVRRGVTVNIVVDAVGAAAMEREHTRRLEEAGARLVRFNPPRWYRLEDVNFRTHRKILVVDGEVAFTGGASVADHWLPSDEDQEGWRDTQIRIRGPLVRAMEGAFYENFLQAGGPWPACAGPCARPRRRGRQRAPRPQLVDRRRQRAEDAVPAEPGLGARTIDIASPYFLADASVMWSLEDAVRRGVRVRLLLESEETDAMPVKYASRAPTTT